MHTATGGHNHFVVLVKAGVTSAVLHDPAIGRRTLSLAELSKKFTGVALEAWPTEGFQPRNEKTSIRIIDLVRRTRGIGAAALQILAISLLIELATLAMPIGFQVVLDEVIVAADYDLLTIVALGLVVLLLLQVAGALARSWTTMLIGSSLALQWKASLFDRLMRLPLVFFDKRHVGDVVSRFGSIDAVQRTLTTSAIQALLDGVMSVTLVLMMWLYGGWLVMIALASVAVYAVIRLLCYPPYRAISEEAIVYAANEHSHFMESVRGISSLKVLNLEERRRGVWINHLIDRVNAELRVGKFDALFSAAGSALFGLDRVLLIYLGGRAILGRRSVHRYAGGIPRLQRSVCRPHQQFHRYGPAIRDAFAPWRTHCPILPWLSRRKKSGNPWPPPVRAFWRKDPARSSSQTSGFAMLTTSQKC